MSQIENVIKIETTDPSSPLTHVPLERDIYMDSLAYSVEIRDNYPDLLVEDAGRLVARMVAYLVEQDEDTVEFRHTVPKSGLDHIKLGLKILFPRLLSKLRYHTEVVTDWKRVECVDAFPSDVIGALDQRYGKSARKYIVRESGGYTEEGGATDEVPIAPI